MLSNAALVFHTKRMFEGWTTVLLAWVPQKPGTAVSMRAELHCFVSLAKLTHAGLNISHLSTQHSFRSMPLSEMRVLCGPFEASTCFQQPVQHIVIRKSIARQRAKYEHARAGEAVFSSCPLPLPNIV
jgi:hypothetical protein